MSSRLLTVIEIGFIALAGLAVLMWFRGNTIIMTSASVWPLNWRMFLQETLSVWDDSVGMGWEAVRQLAFLPLALIGVAAEALRIPPSFFQQLIFYGWFAGSGMAMWWLCSLFGFGRLARVVSALFYMVCPYALTIIWSQSDGIFMPFFAAAPLGLGLFVVTVFGQRGWFRMLVANLLLLSTMITASFSNPAMAVIFWLPCFLALAGRLILYPVQRWGLVWAALRFVLVWLVVNVFWILPFTVVITEQFHIADHQLILQAEDPSQVLRNDFDIFRLGSVRAVDVLRLTGLWSVGASYGPDPYYVWAQLMHSWPAFFLSFLIPALLLIGLLSLENRRSNSFFLLIFIIGSLLIVGSYPPLAEWRVALFKELPMLLRAFRSVYGKFGGLLALGAAPLIGQGVVTSYRWMRLFSPRWAVVAVGLLLVGLLGVGGWPAWNGDVINPGGYLLQPGRVKIPWFYSSFRQWSLAQPDFFRILSLPLSKTGSTAYHWSTNNGYVGGDFVHRFSPGHPLLWSPLDNYLFLVLAQAIEQPSFLSSLGAERLFGLLNTRFVLWHRDFHWPANANSMMFNDERSVQGFVERPFLALEQRWGDLVLLRVSGLALPKIYAVHEPVLVVGSGADAFGALSLSDLPYPTALLLVTPQQARDDQSRLLIPIRQAVVTTSVDEELLAQARRELSAAQSDQSPALAHREIAVRVLQHSVDMEHGVRLYAPLAGKYVVALAQAWLTTQRGLVGVTITDATGQQHYLGYQVGGRTGEQGYKSVGFVVLPRGTFQVRTEIDGKPLGSVPPGMFLFYTPFVKTAEPAPRVDFKRSSATAYSVTVSGVTKPFLLVFSEAYHRYWRAAIREKNGSLRWLAPAAHVRVNGYANGWWIQGMGDEELVIVFQLQYYFWFSLVIMGVALGAAGLLWLWRRLYNKHYAT